MSLREVDDGSAELPSEQWLHLDVSMGVAGDMLTGALLDLGLSQTPVRAALQATGVFEVGLRAHRGERRGVAGLEVAYVDESGRPVEVLGRPPPKSPRGTRRPRLERGARQKPQPDRRHEAKAASALKEIEAEDGEALTLTLPPTETPARGRGDDEPADGRRALVRRWLEGERASGAELFGLLEGARLGPVTRALALKTMRRLVSAKAEVARLAPDEIWLPGPGAVDAVCDIVGVAALIDALAPSMITASVLPLSTSPVVIDDVVHPGPAPWTVACAAGLRTREVELAYGCTTPTGAALVWALAHRVGPRAEAAVQRVGTGLGGYDPTDRVNCCRAFLAPLPSLSSSAGAAHGGEMLALSARFTPLVPLEARIADLYRRGAKGGTVANRRDEAGAVVQHLEVLIPVDEAEALVREVLASAGCLGLSTHLARFEAPGFREVTVPLGPRHARKTVRVSERLLDGDVIDFVAHEEDVAEVARVSGLSLGEVRREALEAYHRLVGATGAEEAER